MSCSMEGRLLETVLKAEQDAAPAAAARNRRAGRPRPVVRRHQDRLPSMAGRWGDDGWRKPPRSQAGLPALRPTEARRRGQKSRRWSAAWRSVPSQGAATPQGVGLMVAPRGAPSPFGRKARGPRGLSRDGPARGLDKEYGRWRMSDQMLRKTISGITASCA